MFLLSLRGKLFLMRFAAGVKEYHVTVLGSFWRKGGPLNMSFLPFRHHGSLVKGKSTELGVRDGDGTLPSSVILYRLLNFSRQRFSHLPAKSVKVPLSQILIPST